jgi:hypothetical protein
MSADDVVAKTIPEIGVVVLTGHAPAFGAANIVPVVNQLVLQDLVQWITERGYHYVPGPGREVWVHDKDEPTDPGLQVFEIQLPFTRSAP